MITALHPDDSLIEEAREALAAARTPKVRPMQQFAEEEIIVPEGPRANLRFRASVQPFAENWFAAVDSHQRNLHAAVGPTQTGKTLLCVIIPMMFHLFELKETVICGLPSMKM